MSDIESLLNIEQVRAWAKSKPADACVGLAGICSGCPLATYLNESDPEHTYEVTETRIQIDGFGRIIAPFWFKPIVQRVDFSGFDVYIHAAEFLAILDSVASEVQP